jgi:hypothetical protein
MVSKFRMQIIGSSEVDLDSYFILKSELQVDDIEKACAGWSINEDVEVTAFDVVAVEGGAEQARVGHAGFEDYPADGVAVLGESF